MSAPQDWAGTESKSLREDGAATERKTLQEDGALGKGDLVIEGFTALSYPGYLPGFYMGFNRHGFVHSINLLFPRHVQPDKTGWS